MIFPYHRVILLHPGKTAGTALEAAFGYTNATHPPDRLDYRVFKGWDPHAQLFLQHAPSRFMVERIPEATWNASLRIATIRNPFDRLLSVYCFQLERHQRWYGDFDRFVAALPRLLRERKPGFDLHLAPQLEHTHLDGQRVVERLLRFEQIEADYASLRECVPDGPPLPPVLARVNSAPGKRERRAPAEEYTRASVRIVHDLYGADFEELGYPLEPPDEPESVRLAGDSPDESSGTPATGSRARERATRVSLWLPSGERLELSEAVPSLAVLKQRIEAATHFPAGCQELRCEGVSLRALPACDAVELDLVLRIGSYAIASPRVSADLDDEVFHPAAAIERSRDIETFKALCRRVRFSDDRPLRNTIDLSDPTRRANERLDPYRRHADARRGRLRELRERLEPGALLAMTCNAPYATLLENWHASCLSNDIDVRSRTVLFPMDREADAVGRALGYATFFDPDSYGIYESRSDVAFGDRQWLDCLFMKNAVMGDMLAAGFDVLFQDVDMVWRRDPLPLLSKKADRERWDFMFQRTGPNAKFQPTFFNSGFVFARSNEFSRHAWEQVLENQLYVYLFKSQQAPLNVLMGVYRERGLRVCGLPPEGFVNGHQLPSEPPEGPLHPQAYVIHFNWTADLAAKLDRLRRLGVWYLEDPEPGAEAPRRSAAEGETPWTS